MVIEMKVHARIQKWGNSLALRICGPIRDIPSFQEGAEVEISITQNGFIVKKICIKKKTRFPFSEAELLNGLTYHQAHGDLLAKPLSSEFDND